MMMNEKTLYSTPKDYISIKERDGYYYAERYGKNSIAFILYDKNRKEHWGLIEEYKPSVDARIITAFGGSLDKDGKTVKEICKEEVLEEAGFSVELSDIKYCGAKLVSTQMNQICYLFLVNVTNKEQVGRQPQNAIEEEAIVMWRTTNDILHDKNFMCWKTESILNRVLKK